MAMGQELRVELREITPEMVHEICALSDTLPERQRAFVASNEVSLTQAQESTTAWVRAIYADGEPAGLIMIADNVEKQTYFLWRLMVAKSFQGRGIGRRAVELLIDYVRTRPGAQELLVSYVPAEDGPSGFYSRLGFVPTGQVEGKEHVASLDLATPTEGSHEWRGL